MNKSKYCITLDLHESVSSIELTAKKGDTAREIIARLCERGAPYEIAEGCTAGFIMDGHSAACTIEDGYIVYNFTGAETTNVGVHECEFVLRQGNEQLTTPSFQIAVEDVLQTAS